MPNKFRILDSKQLMPDGLDVEKLLRILIAFDYKTIPGMTAKTEGTLDQWTKVFNKSPEAIRYLVGSNNRIVGYWYSVALKPKFYKQVLNGKVLDGKITHDKIMKMKRHHSYYWYNSVITIEHRLRHTKASRMLIRSFFDTITNLAKKDIFIKEMCSNAFTEDGEHFYKNMGMRYAAKVRGGGKMYARSMYPFTKNDPLMRNRELVRLYKRKFEKSHID